MNLETLVLKVLVTGDIEILYLCYAFTPVGFICLTYNVPPRVPLGGPHTPTPDDPILPELHTKVLLNPNIFL